MNDITRQKLESYKGQVIMIWNGDKIRITEVKPSEPGVFDVHGVWLSGDQKGRTTNLFNVDPKCLEKLLSMYRDA